MVNCIGALVWRREGDTSGIWIVDKDFCNLKNIKTARKLMIKVSTNGIAMR